MNNHITYNMVVDRLGENNLPYKVIQLDQGIKIVVSQRGGRIFGSFLSEDSESVFWMNSVFKDAGAFKKFLDAGEWNTLIIMNQLTKIFTRSILMISV
jgi:hypothetical protein